MERSIESRILCDQSANDTKSREGINRQNRVIIVGGGVGGLSAAALLAKQSFDVTLYEKNSILGGRASCKNMKGYTLDSGIHALRAAEKSTAAQILEMLGKPIEFAIKNSDGVMPMIYHDGRMVDAPYTTLNLIKYPLLNLLQRLKLAQIVRKASKSNPEEFDNVTVMDWLKDIDAKILEDKHLVAHLKLFLSIGFYCDADLDQMSTGDVIRLFKRYPYDVGYPKGGWAQIIDKLSESIEENSGRIVVGKAVDGVIVNENKEAKGVVVEGSKEVADAVILNVPPKNIPPLIPKEQIPKSFAESLVAYENSSGIVIDVVGIPSNLLNTKYDTVVNLDPCAILRISSKYDNSIAPPGNDILTAWMPISSSIIDGGDKVESKFAQLHRIIEEIFPGILANSEFQRRMVFDTVIGRYPLVSSAPSFAKRLPIQFPDIRSLYIVGDAADAEGIGGSSDAAFMSALNCTELILQKKRLQIKNQQQQEQQNYSVQK
jgi:phytoene dehydrogenase-like protein